MDQQRLQTSHMGQAKELRARASTSLGNLNLLDTMLPIPEKQASRLMQHSNGRMVPMQKASVGRLACLVDDGIVQKVC